ncbi:MAG: peptidoglycan DD-metalloendopeptidase family protein [Rhodanobacter sp.]
MLRSMDRCLRYSVTFTACLLLAACGTMRSSVLVEPAAGVAYGGGGAATARTPVPGGAYVVAKGDTLYSIAFRNGVDFRDLAQWNSVAAPYTIWPGQTLKLAPPVATHAAATTSSVAATAASTHAPVTAPKVAATAAAPVFEPVTTPSTATASAPAVASVAHVATPAVAMTSAAATVVPVAGTPTPAPTVAPTPAPVPVASGASRAVSGLSWRWPADGALIKRFHKGDAIPGIEIGGKAGDPVRAAADGVVVYSGNGLVGYGELVIIKHSDSFLSAYGHNRKRLVKEGQRVSAGQKVAEMGSTGTTRNELQFQIRKDGNPVDPMDYLPAR